MTIKELAKKYRLKRSDFWKVRSGTWVVKHDAVERIADIEDIRFEVPQVYFEMNSVMMLGSASITRDKGQRASIWSTGEASDLNVKGQGKYFFAMAEKRLKDRLTLKLINAYEYGIYSDVEADSFKKNGNNEIKETKKYKGVSYIKIQGKYGAGWVPEDQDLDKKKYLRFWDGKDASADAKIGLAIENEKADKDKKYRDENKE